MKKTIEKYLEQYEKKENKAWLNYQDSGNPYYLRSYEKYKVFINILILALNAQNNRNIEVEKRNRNITSYLEKLQPRDYSFSEVKKIINDLRYM